MSTVRNAVAFLTRFPVANATSDAPGAAAFGLVGAAVGGVAAVPLAVLAGPAGEPWLGAIAAVATMTIVTGGLHLDGLADTSDALSARSAEAAERARKDPRLGAGGVISIVLVVGAEIAALVSVAVGGGAVVAALVLVAVASASRVVPVLASLGLARPGASGATTLGSWFSDRATRAGAALALGSAVLTMVALALAGGALVVVGGTASLVLGYAAAAAIDARRHGLDGDAMGAIVELSVVAGLGVAALAA